MRITATVSVAICFNPRPCVRGDEASSARSHAGSGFNPRPCVRGDRARSASVTGGNSFNPRPCVRGDMRHTPSSYLFLLFQSTPLCEGRRELLVDAL